MRGAQFARLGPAALALLASAPLALFIHRVTERWAARPELGVAVVAAAFGLLAAGLAAGYLAVRRGRASPATLGIGLLALVATELVAICLYSVSFEVALRADILIWAEGPFVNDILKFRLGLPIYSPDPDNEAFIYTPGAPLLTYLVSALFGKVGSIPFYRVVQLGYAVASAVVAFYCCRILVRLAGGAERGRLWGLVWLPALFLIATNALTNPYVHNLHNDSLAQLVMVTGYLLLLKYVETRDRRLLAAMAVVPAAGFFVKQVGAIWAGLYTAFLLLFDRPRSWRRVAGTAAAALGGVAALVGILYALWGEPFVYWVFHVPGTRGVSPLRSLQHVLDTWPYWVIGLLGGLAVLSRARSLPLLGAWAVWLALMSVEAYTSGIAWMLNHLGPGSLLAGIWFLAALPIVWDAAGARAARGPEAWLSHGAAVAVLVLSFSGLGLVRIPVRSISPDVERYIQAIEAEFDGLPADAVLLDAGTWPYVRDGVVMKDRASSIGDRGLAQSGDFSGMLRRLEERRYAKILVRKLHEPDFWYEHYLWPAESGIRRALLENYREVRRIPGVEGASRYLLSDISVLVPRDESEESERLQAGAAQKGHSHPN